jgi:hypothetical protein
MLQEHQRINVFLRKTESPPTGKLIWQELRKTENRIQESEFGSLS